MGDVEKDDVDNDPQSHDEDTIVDPESGDLHDDVTMPPEVARTSVDSPGVHDDATLPPKSCSGPFENTVDMPASGDGLTEASTSAGTRVWYFGDYELLEEIARGGMGVVYKARQVNLNRIVALKMILTGQLASEEDVQRFYTEAEAAAKLEHPGIVPIFEIGEHGGQHFFSMGFIDGESLADRLKEGPLPPREAASLTRQIAEAIAFAHENNVIHRDLKPANVLIDRNGQAKVTDFGLAKQTDGGAELTGTGQILGTPGYMPPEQAAGDTKQIGPAADIYSLGAVLYALLTGRAPFQSASVMDTLIQVLEQEPVAPRQMNAAVDQDLETICLKCLQKEPGQRYQSAGDLSADLQRYLNGEAVLARPIGQAARLWRWCKRNRSVATLMATVAVTLVVGIALSSYFAVEANNERIKANNERNNAVILAAEKDKLAREKTKLAQEKTKLAADETAARRLAETRRIAAEESETKERAARKDARRNLYVAHMNLVQQAFDLHDPGRGSELLQRHLPRSDEDDLRGFEWYFWWRQCHRYSWSVNHKPVLAPMHSLTFSPDGKLVAALGADGTLRLLDVTNGESKMTLKASSLPSSLFVTLSDDGKTLVEAGIGFEVTLWNVATGMSKSMPLKGAIVRAISPDGKTVASSSINERGSLTLWSVETGELKGTIKGNNKNQGFKIVVFSSDGKTVATTSSYGENTIKLWDVDTSQLKITLKGHKFHTKCVTFAPDGKTLASGGNSYGVLDEIKIWDAASGEVRATLKGDIQQVNFLDFSPDGKTLVSGSGRPGTPGEVTIWDVENAKQKTVLRGHFGGVYSVKFSPDGKLLASGSYDNTVKLWEVSPRERQATTLNGRTVNLYMAFSPDGHTLATAGGTITAGFFGLKNTDVQLWNTVTGELRQVLGHTKPVTCVAFSPDGRTLASGSGLPVVDEAGELKIWNIGTGEVSHSIQEFKSGVTSVAFSPDGSTIASGCGGVSSSPEIKLWDSSTGNLKASYKLQRHGGWVKCITFSPDGKTLASGYLCIEFGQGGSPYKPKLILWNVATGEQKAIFDANADRLAFSPDGKTLASSAVNERAVKLWDVSGGRVKTVLKGHTMEVNSITYSPDGNTLASGSNDKTVRLWDASTGELKTILRRNWNVTSVAFSPDSKTLAVGSVDGSVKLWRAATEKEVLPFVANASTSESGDQATSMSPKAAESQPRRKPAVTAPKSSNPFALLGDAAIAKRNLKRIGLAFHNFHGTYGHLPPAVIYGPDGKPWHSWRVLLLPFLDAKALYAQYRFDEPWNSPNNRKLLKKIPDVYHNPKNKTHFTHYVVVTGERTPRGATAFPVSGVKFDGKGDVFKAMSEQKAGVTKFADFIDGHSNVILAGTVTSETEIPWMKPEDLEFAKAIRPLGTKGSFGTPYKTGQKEFGVFLFGDGRVRTLPRTLSVETLRRMILINDQKPVVFEDVP